MLTIVSAQDSLCSLSCNSLFQQCDSQFMQYLTSERSTPFLVHFWRLFFVFAKALDCCVIVLEHWIILFIL